MSIYLSHHLIFLIYSKYLLKSSFRLKPTGCIQLEKDVKPDSYQCTTRTGEKSLKSCFLSELLQLGILETKLVKNTCI